MRNMAAALLLSHGVPMVQMGDEYGHTKVASVCVDHSSLLGHACSLSLHTGRSLPVWYCCTLRAH